MKTAASNRRVAIQPSMKQILSEQNKQTEGFQTLYVFINTAGRPILQDKLRELWRRTFRRSKLLYRRMDEPRHTFASYTLAVGESPE
jgi:hypothetical protein